MSKGGDHKKFYLYEEINFIEPYLIINNEKKMENDEDSKELTFEDIYQLCQFKEKAKEANNSNKEANNSDNVFSYNNELPSTSNSKSEKRVPPVNNSQFENRKNKLESLESSVIKTIDDTNKEIKRIIEDNDEDINDQYLNAILEALSNVETTNLLDCVTGILDMIQEDIP